jgi:competence protein ComEA
MKINKEGIVWLVTGIFTGIIALVLFLAVTGRTRPATLYISPPPPSDTPLPTNTPGPVRVHISGEVSRPDVYALPAGGIVQDVVVAAGGFSETADKDVVNLALPLVDGMHIHVPSIEENVTVPLVSEGSSRSGNLAGSLVNINSATLEELDTLPGIGPGTAQKIIDYRQTIGPFQTVDDVINVSGIGMVKFEQIKELITVR